MCIPTITNYAQFIISIEMRVSERNALSIKLITIETSHKHNYETTSHRFFIKFLKQLPRIDNKLHSKLEMQNKNDHLLKQRCDPSIITHHQ